MAPEPREGVASYAAGRPTKEALVTVELLKQCWSDAQTQQKFGLRESETPQ